MTQAVNQLVGGAGAAQIAAAAATARAEQRAELAQAAKGFEAIFTRQLLGTMRNASLGESIDGSSAVSQFQEMSDAQLAKDMAEKGGLGIAEMLLQQLDR